MPDCFLLILLFDFACFVLEFLFIPLLGFSTESFSFSIFSFLMLSLMPASLSRYIFLLVLGLYDSPLPPCSSILSCARPPQYISLGLLIVPVFLPCRGVG